MNYVLLMQPDDVFVSSCNNIQHLIGKCKWNFMRLQKFFFKEFCIKSKKRLHKIHCKCIIIQKSVYNCQSSSCIKQFFVLEYREILEKLILRCMIIGSFVLFILGGKSSSHQWVRIFPSEKQGGKSSALHGAGHFASQNKEDSTYENQDFY